MIKNANGRNYPHITAAIAFLLILLFTQGLALASQENLVYTAISNSDFGSCFSVSDDLFIIRGSDRESQSDWLSLINVDGESKWQYSSQEGTLFRHMFLLNQTAYISIGQWGVHPYDQETELVPVDLSGEATSPISLPNWIGSAYPIVMEKGVLFSGVYERDEKHYLKLAMYDKEFKLLWETSTTKKLFPANLILKCISMDDGFVVCGSNHTNQTSSLAKFDLNGKLSWSKTYKLKAEAKDLALWGDHFIVLGDRINAIKEHGSEFLFALDSKGKILWERKLTEDDGSITLNEIVACSDGYLLTGSRGCNPLALTLDDQCQTLDIVDFPYVIDFMSKFIFADDNKLFLFGLNVNDAGTTDGIICYEMFEKNTSWLEKIM